MSRLTRRVFLGHSAAAASALALGPGRSLAAGANSEVAMGFIGLGGQGSGLLHGFAGQPGVRVAALCDADSDHLANAAKKHPGAVTTQDLRKVIENPDIDAVVVATPNHWHCLAAIWAVQNGKDVYVEKPLGHNVWEGRQLVNAAKLHNRVVQIGTQQRSDPLQAEVKAYLHEDHALGKPLYVQVCRYGVRAPIGKRQTALTPPKTLDYNLWLGPAADQPIFRDRFHYDWHWDYNAGNGEMGNWCPHVVDDVRNVPLQDKVALPNRVFACGGRVVWDDAGESPNVHFAYFDTPEMPVFLGMSNLPAKPRVKKPLSYEGVDTGYVVHCEDGMYTGWRGGGKAYDKQGKLLKEFRGRGAGRHAANFLAAVRAGDASLLNAPVETGHQSTNWCHLANIGFQSGGPGDAKEISAAADGHPGWDNLVGQMHDHLASYDIRLDDAEIRMSPVLSVDGLAERFTGQGSESANALLKREYRQGFEVPTIVV